MSEDKCYICLDSAGILRRPCINDKCTIRAHSECLKKQVTNKKDKCGACNTSIVITGERKFNLRKMINYLGLVLSKILWLLFFIFHIISVIFLVYGIHPITLEISNITIGDKNIGHFSEAWSTVIIFVWTFVRLGIYIDPKFCNPKIMIQKCKNYYPIAWFIIDITCIIISQIIGSYVISGEINIMFNPLTFLTGLITVIYVISTVLILYVSFIECHHKIRDNFYDNNCEYGVNVKDDEIPITIIYDNTEELI